MAESMEVVNGVSTTPAQPNILRGRKGTLGRAATIMFTGKPLAPPPTIFQSIKAILIASCSCEIRCI